MALSKSFGGHVRGSTIPLGRENSSTEPALRRTWPGEVCSLLSVREGVCSGGRYSPFLGFSCKDVLEDKAGVDECCIINALS